MPFRHFLYFFPRLSTLLILTILRHLSLKPGHIAHFNTLYALHVPQTRTHSALQRHICPICPSAPDTWRTSTPYMPYMSLKPGHMAHFNGVSAPHVPQSGHMKRLKGGANTQRRDTGVTKGVAAQRGIGAGIDSWWLRRGVVGNEVRRESTRNGHSRA